MQVESTTQPRPNLVICRKCDHPNPLDILRCESCLSHLYVSCKHCGVLNTRTEDRCEECRTQLHQRGKNMWRRAKARKWIHPVSYVLVAVASVLTFYGVVKISQHDFTKSRPEAIYIEVDGETLDRIQGD